MIHKLHGEPIFDEDDMVTNRCERVRCCAGRRQGVARNNSDHVCS